MTLAQLLESVCATILSAGKKEVIIALVECARFIVSRRVPLTPGQLGGIRQSAKSHLVLSCQTIEQQ